MSPGPFLERTGRSVTVTAAVPRDPERPVVEVDLIEEPLAGQPAPAAVPESGAREAVEPLPVPGADAHRSSTAVGSAGSESAVPPGG